MTATIRFFVFRLMPVILLFSFVACSSTKPLGNPEQPYPPTRPPHIGDILHLPTGYYVSFEQMISAASSSRIIYVGEIHDNPAAHRLQLEILAELTQRFPGKLALGIEMFTPAQQEALDRWVAGELTEKEFLRQSNWYKQWQISFDYYRPLFMAARDHKIKLVGLNADKALVKTVGRTPLEELSEELKATLPEMDFTDPYQRAVTSAIFGGHAAGGPVLEGFLRVQTLWDETMAENIAAYLSQPEHVDHKMIVIAGGNHVKHGYGIPRRVFRRLPVAYTIISSKVMNLSAKKQREKLMDVKPVSLPMPPCDYITFVTYEDLPVTGVKLGIILRETDGKVIAAKVFPETPAQSAGLLNGDTILRFNSTTINDKIDLFDALHNTQPDDTIQLEIERNGSIQTLTVTFPTVNIK